MSKFMLTMLKYCKVFLQVYMLAQICKEFHCSCNLLAELLLSLIWPVLYKE